MKYTDRHASLSNSQIISYEVNNDESWSSLVGIAQENGRVVGHIQLFSKSRNISQAIEGHASSFATIKLDGGSSDSQLLLLPTELALDVNSTLLKSITRKETHFTKKGY